MPFGIISTQDEFQRQMDDVLQGLTCQIVLVDDILVFGNTLKTHDQHLKSVLDRRCRNNVHLNKDKLNVAETEVKYYDHIKSNKGMKPDPSKVGAVKHITPPNNKKELQTILGMITYLTKFTPQLAELTAPLRELLKKDNTFLWDHQHPDVRNNRISNICRYNSV